MARIQRKLFATFLNCTPTETTATYEQIGHGIEEFSVEMNPNVSKKTDILGENAITIDKYEKTSSIESYIADLGTAQFTYLKGIIDNEKLLDDLKTDVIHVYLFETATSGAYPAVKEGAYVAVKSYGGNTEGFQIPYDLHYDTKRIHGKFNPTTKTFTADA